MQKPRPSHSRWYITISCYSNDCHIVINTSIRKTLPSTKVNISSEHLRERSNPINFRLNKNALYFEV